MEYNMVDAISKTSMGLTRGSVSSSYISFLSVDVLEYWKLDIVNMTAVMSGEPWMQSNMMFEIDGTNNKLSIAMDNNTTKLPMDMDFTITVDAETSQVTVAMNMASDPPPTAIVERLDDLEMTLEGLTEILSDDALNAWVDATTQRLMEHFQQGEGAAALDNLVTAIEVVQQEIIAAMAVSRQGGGDAGASSLKIHYNQTISYTTTDADTYSSEAVVVAPFQQKDDLAVYVASLKEANPELEGVTNVMEVVAPTQAPDSGLGALNAVLGNNATDAGSASSSSGNASSAATAEPSIEVLSTSPPEKSSTGRRGFAWSCLAVIVTVIASFP